MTETVRIWFNFSMLFLPESASDEAMGRRAIILSQGPCHVEMSGLLVRLGGGRQPHFSEDFFSRLDHDILVVDDYGYTGIDFFHDLDLGLPDGEDWDASLGML